MATSGKTKLYFSESLQLRSLVNNRIFCGGLFASWLLFFVIYASLIWGRPDQDYWSDDVLTLGSPVNLTLCEEPQLDEFTRMPANALVTVTPICLGVFMILMSLLDLMATRHYESSLGNRPASILVRYPIWSIYIGLNFIFLGGTGFFFHASTLSLPNTLFQIAQWSSILVLALCSVNRLLDPPRKTADSLSPRKEKCRKIAGNMLATILILGHVGITVSLVFELDNVLNPVQEREVELAVALPKTVLYGLVFLGVLSAVIHWRAHSLTIIQQPVLLFVGGLLAIVAVGISSYDDISNDFCFRNSFFQINALGFFVVNIAALVAYLFFRGDRWKIEKTKLTTFEEIRTPSLHEEENVGSQHAPENQESGGVSPEILGPPPNPRVNPGAAKPNEHSTTRRLDFIVNLSNNASQRIRRATTELASNRIVTPELGFSSGQIRFAEVIIGIIIVAFIIVVIYFTFTSNSEEN